MVRSKPKGEAGDQDDGRQDNDQEDEKRTLEQFDATSGILQGLLIDVNTTPDVAAHPGLGPETIEREGYEIQQEVDDDESPQPRTGHIFNPNLFACTWERI
jgi:hypothetical protein